MKLLILIPCYNTHKYLNDLILLLKSQTHNKIMIVDDGSSPSINIEKFEENNLILMRNNINRGKGYSLKVGFKYAIKNNYTHVITLDGDMQHDPMEINKFIDANQNIDFLLGSRKFSKPMPFSRIISNTITSKIISIFKSKLIKDSQCGYRRYRVDAIKDFLFLENGYLFESEILLNCINKNMKIHNINIRVIYDGSPSHINKLSDSIGFIRLIMRYIFA